MLALVLPQLKAELKLSDTTLGVLAGPAFMLVYAFAGIPVAWIADSLGGNPFTVYTGDVVNGVFTASDHQFNIEDICGP